MTLTSIRSSQYADHSAEPRATPKTAMRGKAISVSLLAYVVVQHVHWRAASGTLAGYRYASTTPFHAL